MEANITRKIKNFRQITGSIYASGLPNGLDLSEIKNKIGLNTVIDLSDRKRSAVENWCLKNSVSYIKIPINEYEPNINDFKKAYKSIQGITLIHCFKGIHRTGLLVSMIKVINKENVDKLYFEYSNKCKKTHPKLTKLLSDFIYGTDIKG